MQKVVPRARGRANRLDNPFQKPAKVMPLQAIDLTGSVLFSGALFFPYNHRCFHRAIVLSTTIVLSPTIVLSQQPSLFFLLSHPIILSPSIVLSIKDQRVPVPLFFRFCICFG